MKFTKNKLMAFLSATIMLLSLAACGDKNNSAVTSEAESKIEAVAESTSESAAESIAESVPESVPESAAESTTENKEASGIVGYYTLTGMESGDMKLDLEQLKAIGMADGAFLQLNKDGTGELCAELDKNTPITYDEKAGTITATDGDVSISFPFTMDGDTITVVFDDGASTLCYTRKA